MVMLTLVQISWAHSQWWRGKFYAILKILHGHELLASVSNVIQIIDQRFLFSTLKKINKLIILLIILLIIIITKVMDNAFEKNARNLSEKILQIAVRFNEIII